MRDSHLAASSRCRLAMARLLLLQTTEAWCHTLSLSQRSELALSPCLLPASRNFTTLCFSPGPLLIPRMSSFHRTAVAQQSSDAKIPEQASVAATRTARLLCSLLSPRASVRSLLHLALPSCIPSPQKAQPWRGSSLLQRPRVLPNNSSLPQTRLVLDQT